MRSSNATNDVTFALRTALAGVAALFVAMWLQLDLPRWAIWTVVIVSPPVRGNALRKTAARIAGTVVACIVAVGLVALFPQSRVGFYTALFLWLGACAYWATLRTGYVSYAAVLAAFTTVIVSARAPVSPLDIWYVAFTRGSATLVGILFAYLASEIGASSDDIPGDLAGRVRSLATDLLEWAIGMLKSNKSDEALDAPLTSRILGLNEVCVNALAERPALRWVKTWIIGLPTALLAFQSAVLELCRRTAGDANTWLTAEELLRISQFLRSESALDPSELRRQSTALNEISNEARGAPSATKPIIDPLRYLLTSLEAMLSMRPPKLNAPCYPRPELVADRRLAAINFTRMVVGMSLGFLVWDLSAWTHGSVFLVILAVSLVMFVKLEDPLAANRLQLVGILIGGTVALAVKYLILAPLTDPVILAGALFLLTFFGAWIQTKSKLAVLGPLFMIGVLIVIEPMNPQPYDFTNDVNVVFALTFGCAFAGIVFLSIRRPAQGAARVAELLRRMRRLRDQSAAASSRAWQLRWQSRIYDELQRVQAATGRAKDRAAAAGLVLSGLRRQESFAISLPSGDTSNQFARAPHAAPS